MTALLLVLVVLLGILGVFKTLWLIGLSKELRQLRRHLDRETESREADVTWLQNEMSRRGVVVQFRGRGR